MPTYEYKCEACGHTFEKFQSMSSAPIRKCPVCGKSKVKRLIGAGAGLIFKGSGFYITDYRSDAYNQAAKKDAPATTTADSSKPADGKSGEAKTTDAAKTPAPAAPVAESKLAASSSEGKASSGESKSSSGDGKASSSASKTRTKSAKGKS
ncbi:MAG: zinc ribbon domain-containing protein [Tepidisphaeraceae bacterium]|jgi:putative FmdB family regulatory protein